ncbi:type III effector protein [Streptomyces sp. RKAG293]|uniref:type III effector protein n=1 Tax=Streptomyces sp. RKAG293 TaxID=2893403 RepID=UPI0020343C35|nr:type III effector protein [Streptomyces sp. RKAG293]MCM2422683.1 type III effector protein [Streptomyces sp. RKAG293]
MTGPGHPTDPASLLAASIALDAINEAVHTAQTPQPGQPPQTKDASSGQALAALLLLRELRDQLAGWEPSLIEAARDAGASWAELAHPLGVASRQAAERRYLRVRSGAPGSTGEQRVQATRNRRAADRNITTWARDNAADLRQLAGQITALTDLPSRADTPLAALADALAHDDATHLLDPLTATRTHLQAGHTDLATRIDTVTRHTDQLRRDSGDH